MAPQSNDVEQLQAEVAVLRQELARYHALGLSPRRLESLRRAEAVAQETRYQLARPRGAADLASIAALLRRWMQVTGLKVKYTRPV